MSKQKWLLLILSFFFFSLPANSTAYDSDNNSVDALPDAIFSLQESRRQETIHTLLILTGNNPDPALYFTRSDNGHLVTDLTEGLMWQDYSLSMGTQSEGQVYCAQSELDGYDDWELPTFEELQRFFKAVDRDTSFDLYNWGSFPGCTALVAVGGYVRTPRGAEVYGGEVGDQINFSGHAGVRCVRAVP